jgi:NDP-sugar pyrophosphorylase family protein
MAGGEGRRLRPLTDRLPKPMVPVAGRPILERIVLHLVGYGVKRIYISVNYMAEVITEHFGDGERFGCAITYLRESTALGTGGPLSLIPDAPSHPVLVMNGDLVTQVDVSRLLQFHEREGACATLAARHYQVEIPFGVVTQRDNQLIDLLEKPTPHYLINAGIYVLEPEVLPLVPADTFFPITTLFEKLLEDKRRVAVYSIEEDWIDVGRREELRRANEGA